MIVNYITGGTLKEIVGLSRYSQEIYENLKDKVEFNFINYKARENLILSIFFRHLYYPILIKRKIKQGITHITSQNQSHVLNWIKPKKTLITVHDLIPYIIKSDHDLLTTSDFRFCLRGIKKADKVIAISEFTKNDLIKHLKIPEDKITVIYQGVNEQYKKLSNFKKPEFFAEKNILFVGSEQKRKNLTTLIKAFYLVKKKISNVRLIKVGKPQHGNRKELINLIKQLNLQNDVIFVGYVKENDLPIYYNAADVFCFPSLYEGFGLPILEAMSCGCPVISSCLTSLPEVVGDAGILIEPTEEKFAEKIEELLENEKLRNELAEKGIKRAKEFSWKKTAEETFKVYEQLSQ